MSVSVQRLGETFVAEVTGLDLSKPLDDAAIDALHDAYRHEHVIAVRGQDLTPEQVIATSRLFGPVEPHLLEQYHHDDHKEILMVSNVVEDGEAKGLADAGSYWHSDVSYKAKPSRASMLYAVEVPAEGGDTLFCDMVAAYDALPEETKRRIADLKAVHNYAYRTNQQVAAVGVRPKLSEEQLRATPDAIHPVVRTHPETGVKAIFINPGFTVRFVDMPEDESEALKQELFDHCLQDRFIYRYKWRPGDALIWDNATVMHKATVLELPPGTRRTMHRTVISGDVPF